MRRSPEREDHAAPLLRNVSTNCEAFLAWAEQIFAATLAKGDVVIMDNLPAHMAAGVR